MIYTLWKQQTFRRQLKWILSGLVLLTSILILLASTLVSRYFLLQRAFNLLNATSKISVSRIHEKLTETKKIDFNVLSAMLSDRTGLGLSGETYVMDTNGKLLTASRFLTGEIIAPLPDFNNDEWVGIKRDYRNISVLAYWRKISSAEFTGILASEIDEEEVLKPLRSIIYYSSGVTIALIIILIYFTRIFSKILAQNLDREKESLAIKQSAMIEGQEAERLRIAYELHDNIGQLLTAFSYRIASANIPEALAQSFSDHLGIINTSVREIIFNLSTAVLKINGLKSSMHYLANEMSKNSPIHTLFEFQSKLSESDYLKISEHKALGLFRITQEAFNNASKHAKAEIVTCYLELKNSTIFLKIEDDGIGFVYEDPQFTNSYGMLSMKARAEFLKGNIKLTTSPGQGSCLEITIPME